MEKIAFMMGQAPNLYSDIVIFTVHEIRQVLNSRCQQRGAQRHFGMYLSESEGARFWLGVLNDLRTRGIEDIIIASIDGLKGFPEAIAEVFPKAEIQSQ